MTDKYYIPDLTDLFIGYEYEEIDDWGDWKRERLGVDNFSPAWIEPKNEMVNIQYKLEKAEIRTEFLTKKQIEAEGWEYKESGKDYGGGTYVYFEKDNWKLQYNLDKRNLWLVDVNNFNDDGNCDTPSFMGFCPSINEFRKINKLLNI